MESLIILSLILAIFQLWLIPMILNIKNLNWMIGTRESPIPETPLVARANRAGSNLQESLPAFLALALLSMILSVDTTNAACWWLIFRVAHGLLYISGIKYLRTISYFGSIGSLIAMACALI